jgi:hypothetical protein
VVVEKLIAVFRARSRDNSVAWYCGKNQGRNCCIRRMEYNRSVPAKPKSTKHVAYSLAGHLQSRTQPRRCDRGAAQREGIRRSSTVRCLEKTRSMYAPRGLHQGGDAWPQTRRIEVRCRNPPALLRSRPTEASSNHESAGSRDALGIRWPCWKHSSAALACLKGNKFHLAANTSGGSPECGTNRRSR